MGPRTRETVGEYQKSKRVTVTKRTNAETAGKLGVEPESMGGEFKGAGHEVGAERSRHEFRMENRRNNLYVIGDFSFIKSEDFPSVQQYEWKWNVSYSGVGRCLRVHHGVVRTAYHNLDRVFATCESRNCVHLLLSFS